MTVLIDGTNCDITVDNILACPLLISTTDFRLTKKEMDTVINSGFSTKDGLSVTTNTNLLKESGLERIQSFMVTFTKTFVREALKITNEFYLTTSWATSNIKGSSHPRHNHPNTLLSALYYAEAESGDLVLLNDRDNMFPNFGFKWNILETNSFNTTEWTIPVRTGHVVIFPGWMNHYSTPNLNDKPRIALGANFFTRGNFGSSNTIDNIEVG